MLNQELVYMGQVFEHHQLYRIQIAMTEDIKQRGLDNYNSHIGGSNSRPVNLNNQVKYPAADPLLSRHHNLQSDLQHNNPGLKKKPLDLQLSADEFIRQAAYDLSGKGILRGFPIDTKNSFQDTVPFNLNYSFIDEDIGVKHRSLTGKLTCRPRPDIIDLEDPNFKFSKNIMNIGIPSSNPCLKNKHKLERFMPSDKHEIQSFSKSRTRHEPFDNVGVTSHRQALLKSGFNGDFMAADTSVSRGRMNLDLNTVQFEDLSCFSNSHSGVVNPAETFFSTTAEKMYPTSWRESNVNRCTEVLDVHVRNNVKRGEARSFIDNTVSKLSQGGNHEGNGNNIIIIDLDSDSGEELCNREEPKIESVGSTSKLSTDLSCEIEMTEAVGEEPIKEKDSKPLLLSHFGRNSMVDSNSSLCDKSRIVDMGSQAAHSSTLEQRSSESPDSKIHCIYNSNEVPVDGTAQKAAELLLKISQQRHANYLGGLEKLNSSVFQRKVQDRPQCSSESYEEMVVNAKECGPDDYCVSSNVIVVDEPEKKESRYKLKRGTRMKDFQKDILSSLSTLSRHEIREDIRIFECVIKSREYKKMQAKKGYGNDWCSPTRSKRSRIGRR